MSDETIDLSGASEAPDTPPVPEAPDTPVAPVGEELPPLDDEQASMPHVEGVSPADREMPLVDVHLQTVIAKSVRDVVRTSRGLDRLDLGPGLYNALTSEAEKYTCRCIAVHIEQAMKRNAK